MPDTPAQHDTGNDSPCITLLPYDADLLQHLADGIITKHRDALPDLSRVVILLPDPECHAQMRKALLGAAGAVGVQALLGPHITSLREWIEQEQGCTRNKISHHERELIMVESLRNFPDLPGGSHPWLLAENLLNLFDELNRQHVRLDSDQDTFSRQLRKAYGIEQHNSPDMLQHLDNEARVVHQLWHAWHEQLDARQADDALGIYHHKLRASIEDNACQYEYWLAGYPQLTTIERDWFDSKAQQQRAFMFRQAQTGRENDTAGRACRLLERVYQNEKRDFAARARQTGSTNTSSPLSGRIRFLPADNEELEACSVELQVRQWLGDNYNNIGIVTQDRRLARRIRALLERAGISMQDSAGWALSTTSAAAALERWLECIELDFDHVALLDLLKTPFIFHDLRDNDYLKTVYRFEQDIVLHENIASGIQRYKRALTSREERLKALWPSSVYSSVSELLTTLEQSAAPLLAMTRDNACQPGRFLEALFDSLRSIGMYSALNADPAGQRVLQELENLQTAARRQPLTMRWSEMRSWIGRTLERYSFKPDTSDNRVTLVDLPQSQLLQFDAVILAGADRRHLPGQPQALAFFNDAVRYALGLPCAEDHQQQQFHYYMCLLNQAPEIVISHHLASREGETMLASKWVEALSGFHKLAFNDDLIDDGFNNILRGRHSGVITDTRDDIPAADCRPAPATPAHLLPEAMSASSYQQIIDCPYRFFAAKLLRLSASDEVSAVLSKTEYGELVHRCLEAFHGGVNHHPGPFPERLTRQNSKQAAALLAEIAQSIFSREVEDNFEHRGWLQRFVSLIPHYIEWQIRHARDWNVQDTEVNIDDHRPGPGTAIKGRLDRIDQNDNGLCIIDYKTGYTPAKKDVASGEAAQLPFYAMLTSEPVYRVEYLKLDNNEVKTIAPLEGDALAAMVDKNTARLNDIMDMLKQQHALPAWGDEKTCSYCDMHGLCRRGNWQTGETA